MDVPVMLFSSLLVSLSSAAYTPMAETAGSSVKRNIVEYGGYQISYQYQLWRIRHSTVCANLRENPESFSQCIIAAQSLFRHTCLYLENDHKKHWKYQKLKNMYCSAAATYKPATGLS